MEILNWWTSRELVKWLHNTNRILDKKDKEILKIQKLHYLETIHFLNNETLAKLLPKKTENIATNLNLIRWIFIIKH